MRSSACLISLTALVLSSPVSAAGQDASPPERSPNVGFVPTQMAIVDTMLTVARVGPNDVVYDLGCGDGRIVIAAAQRRGARGACVEIDSLLVEESRRSADTAGVAERIEFIQGDLFGLDLRPATVVTLYLGAALNLELRPKLFRELRPGTRVLSNVFEMGDWKPDSIATVKTASGFNSSVLFWVMPAHVAGEWSVTIGPGASSSGPPAPKYTLRFEQRFQRLTRPAAATADGRPVKVTKAHLRGDRLAFTVRDSVGGNAVDLRFTGQVTGDKVRGKVLVGPQGEAVSWTGVRTKRGQRVKR